MIEIRNCVRGLAFAISMSLIACSDGGTQTPSSSSSTPATKTDTTASSSGAASSSQAATIEDPAPVAKAETPPNPALLAKRGSAIYVANCQACHHPDPALDGGIGPAIAGSSAALIESRVLRAQYPEGYIPKRDTTLMIALPHLAPDLDALMAFLGTKS